MPEKLKVDTDLVGYVFYEGSSRQGKNWTNSAQFVADLCKIM